MKLIHVGAAALNQTPLDWEVNLANIRQAIDLAKSREVSILCLPELAITGYGCEDAFFFSAIQEKALQILFELLPDTHGITVSVGLPIVHAGALFNASALLVDGELAGFVTKQRLAGDGIHYEPRWFKAWPSGCVAEIEINDKKYPIGDLLFDLDGIRLGFEICEDAWVANRPAAGHASQAVDIILNPSASHFAFGKAEIRERLVGEASRAFCVTYVYSNLLGNEAGRVVYDGQTLIGTQGQIVARGPRLSFQQVLVSDAVIDIDATRMRRIQTASFEPELSSKAEQLIPTKFSPHPALQGESN